MLELETKTVNIASGITKVPDCHKDLEKTIKNNYRNWEWKGKE